MKTHSWIYFLTIISLLFSACKPDSSATLPTYTVSRTDFEDYILIDGQVEPMQTTSISCPSGIDGTIVYLIDDGVRVNEGDLLCVIEDKNLETTYEQFHLDLENAEANLTKTRANLELQYSMLEADVLNNEAQTQIANLDSLQMQYSSPNIRRISELQLEQSAITRRKLEQKLEALKFIQQSEIRKQEFNIQRRKDNLNNILQRMEMLKIYAPKAGLARRVIHRLTDNKIIEGDPIWEGMPIVTIPDMDSIKVLIYAQEADYKRIQPNDLVSFRFDAMPDNRASGRIARKAPMGLPLSRDSRIKIFEIEATVDSILEIPAPGLSTSCQITLQKVSDTIVVPQIAVFNSDSTKVVYVRKGKNYEKREVLQGISSPKITVIRAGLQPGEVISLSKPPANRIKTSTFLPDSLRRLQPVESVDTITYDNINIQPEIQQ